MTGPWEVSIGLRGGRCHVWTSLADQGLFSALRDRPFILPMSGKKSRFTTVGIHFTAAAFVSVTAGIVTARTACWCFKCGIAKEHDANRLCHGNDSAHPLDG